MIDNRWIATYRHTVESKGGWGRTEDAFGAVVIDFGETAGSGPLGNAYKVALKLEQDLGLNDAEILTFVFVGNTTSPPTVVSGDQEFEYHQLASIEINTLDD